MSVIFSWNIIFLALAVNVVIQVVKSIVGQARPELSESKLVKRVILPTLAVVIGATLGAFTGLIPEVLAAATLVDKLAFGAIAGSFSTLIWGAAKHFVMEKLGGVGEDEPSQ